MKFLSEKAIAEKFRLTYGREGSEREIYQYTKWIMECVEVKKMMEPERGKGSPWRTKMK